MKKNIIIFLLFMAFNISTNAQSSGFGLGFVLGEPTGISAKLWKGNTKAFQGAIAWSFGKNDAVRLQTDHLWHFPGIEISMAKLPYYLGIGVSVTFADKFVLAARIPVGIDFQFSNLPLDLFLEIAPGLKLIPDVEFNVDAGLGIRYFFKQ